MNRARIKLDNPVFDGRLRYNHRSSAYVRRSVGSRTAKSAQDMAMLPAVSVSRRSVVRRPISDPRQSNDVILVHTTNVTPVNRLSVDSVKLSKSSKVPAKHLPIASSEKRPDIQKQVHQKPVGVVAEPRQSESLEVEPSYSNKHFPNNIFVWIRHHRQSSLLYAMATVVFCIGVVVSIGGFRANQQVAAQVKQLQGDANTSVGGSTDVVSPKTPPSSKPISSSTVRSYAVAPNLPRYVDIPKLSVHTRVLSEGVDREGALQVPWNIYDTGWYNASSQPGQAGAMLIDGHSGIGRTHGVFHDLAKLVNGDPVIVTRGDGQKFTYQVTSVKIVDVKAVDMSSMMVSTDVSKPGLSLITCTGDQIPGTDQLNKRILVNAVLQ